MFFLLQIHWDVTNLSWDGEQEEGDQLEIGFQVIHPMIIMIVIVDNFFASKVHFSGTPPDLVYADFDGPDHSICGTCEHIKIHTDQR